MREAVHTLKNSLAGRCAAMQCGSHYRRNAVVDGLALQTSLFAWFGGRDAGAAAIADVFGE